MKKVIKLIEKNFKYVIRLYHSTVENRDGQVKRFKPYLFQWIPISIFGVCKFLKRTFCWSLWSEYFDIGSREVLI